MTSPYIRTHTALHTQVKYTHEYSPSIQLVYPQGNKEVLFCTTIYGYLSLYDLVYHNHVLSNIVPISYSLIKHKETTGVTLSTKYWTLANNCRYCARIGIYLSPPARIPSLELQVRE